MPQPPTLVTPPPVPASAAAPPRTCGFATASLICALLPVPLVGAVLAIVFSIKSRRRIARSQGALTGEGLAIAGLICGILFGGIGTIAALAGIGVPVIISQQKKAHRIEAITNARSIGLAMSNFEQEYGVFPDATNPSNAGGNPLTGLTFGSRYSNDYFRQLIASGHCDTERIFYAKAPYTRRPDNNLKGGQCLAAGEAGFAYVTAQDNKSLSTKGNPGRPLIVAATLAAAADGTFDPAAYDRRAVVLRIDRSVAAMMIRIPDKKLPIDKRNHTLLENGPDTVWGADETPVIHPPLPIGR